MDEIKKNSGDILVKRLEVPNIVILLEIMRLPMNVRKYDQDIQYYYIHENIHEALEKLKKQSFGKEINCEETPLSQRQELIWQSVLENFKNKDYLNSYFEIINFIDDDENKKGSLLSKKEYDNIKNVLIGMDKKILESIDLDKTYKKVVDNMNITSNIEFVFGFGTRISRFMVGEDYKGFLLYDNELNIKWLGQKMTIKDEKIVSQIKEVIIKNKKAIYDYSRIKDYGEYEPKDRCHGTIDDLNFNLFNYINNKEVNSFYEQFKTELFNIIEGCIQDDKKDNQESGKNNIDTNTTRGINEKYYGTSGVISIKNILIH